VRRELEDLVLRAQELEVRVPDSNGDRTREETRNVELGLEAARGCEVKLEEPAARSHEDGVLAELQGARRGLLRHPPTAPEEQGYCTLELRGTDEEVHVRRRPQPRLGIEPERERDTFERDGVDAVCRQKLTRLDRDPRVARSHELKGLKGARGERELVRQIVAEERVQAEEPCVSSDLSCPEAANHASRLGRRFGQMPKNRLRPLSLNEVAGHRVAEKGGFARTAGAVNERLESERLSDWTRPPSGRSNGYRDERAVARLPRSRCPRRAAIRESP